VERQITVETETALSRREATLRSAATTSLAGIALVQAIELPSLFSQGGQFGVLSIVAMALCIGLGWALAAAPAEAAPQMWRAVAGASALLLAGWAVPHAINVPGLSGAGGDWTEMPGAACGVLAAASLVLAMVAAPPTRAAARGLLTAAGVLAALVPGVAVLFISLGPGVSGGESVLAASGHIHSHGSPEAAIVFEPLPGGNGGHYVYKAIATPHPTLLGIALVLTATIFFTVGAVGHLRGRTAAAEPVLRSGIEGSLA